MTKHGGNSPTVGQIMSHNPSSSPIQALAFRPLWSTLLILLLLLACQGANPARDKAYYDRSGRYPVGKANPQITVGVILPYSLFETRNYKRSISSGLEPFNGILGKYIFSQRSVKQNMFKLDPSPETILQTLCKSFLPTNVSAIIYLTRDESYGRHTASSQYFLQLAGYLGIPVISWNADNSGLEKASQGGLLLQVAPSIHHQAAAMLSILVRYQWHAFTIVTSYIAGHSDFVQAIREQVLKFSDPTDHSTLNFKLTIIDTLTVENSEEDLSKIVSSEARIMLLYSTKIEAEGIMKAAEKFGLTGKNYVWIVTQSVIGENDGRRMVFPVGMLGVHFETENKAFYNVISHAIRIFGYGVMHFLNDNRNDHVSLNPRISCEGATSAKWENGDNFYRFLKNVSISYKDIDTEEQKRTTERPPLTFLPDGTRSDIELKIMNLRDTPGGHDVRNWEEIGTWRSWEKYGLNINDIVWPGHSHVPPPGVPEKFHMKIAFLEEPPYISLSNTDPETGHCSSNRGVHCRIMPDIVEKGPNGSTIKQNSTGFKCCSGFCIDMLKLFADEMGFTYDLERVEDGKWGTLEAHNKWNGLVAALMNRKADMALTSFKINSYRESVVDFTVPFLESGIAILVAKRTGIISPTAFLEPFDTASWMLVAFVAIQVAALTVFIFEWLSPEGYNMKVAPPREHKFSLLRTYWLVWAVLFQAAVHVDCPKGFTARFMANIWAMFAVVFLAIYTANLAAFMITREEYHDFTGIDDKRLQNPHMKKPPYRFSFVPYTNAETVFAQHEKKMYRYMRPFNKSHVNEGVKAIKTGQLDAFMYDATVLNYLVGQDEECNLLTVGNWYATTGYGIGFTRGSKYTDSFNKKLMEFKENGELERLQRFWLTGACKPKKQSKRASEPLALEQFLSAYLLLVSGVIMALLLLLMEHMYFNYMRQYLQKTEAGDCCALLSLSMGKSLTFRGAVWEAQDKLRRHRCRDPFCDTHIYKVKRELDIAKAKISQLERQLQYPGSKPLPPPNYPERTSTILSSCWRSKPNVEEDELWDNNLVDHYARIDRELLGSREVYGKRDMTRNHISSNDPSSTMRTYLPYTPASSTTQPVSDSLLPTADMAYASTPCLAVASLGEQFQGDLRLRTSSTDIREIAEMETVL